jgi:hypothetical protein
MAYGHFVVTNYGYEAGLLKCGLIKPYPIFSKRALVSVGTLLW